LTYAAIISLVAAKKLEKDPIDFIFDVIKNSDSSGIVSVEKYIENQIDISDIKKQLSYPGTHHDNPLYQIFDQIFYGPELYQKLFSNTFGDLPFSLEFRSKRGRSSCPTGNIYHG
jgi:hypothetical protein